MSGRVLDVGEGEDTGMTSFRLLDLTLPSPIENLALDGAPLEELQEGGGTAVLRLSESDRYFVVLGRSSRVDDDVHVEICRQACVPILRRASGGGTVLQGPGCLSYAFVLPISLHGALRDIRRTNEYFLRPIAAALSRWHPAVTPQGISDLTIEGRKISGNAQRRTRNALLFHGTILYDMHADVISRYLRQPKRQPQYRGDRSHGEFLRTINAPVEGLKEAIAKAWHAHTELRSWPRARMTDAIVNVLDRRLPQEQAIEAAMPGTR